MGYYAFFDASGGAVGNPEIPIEEGGLMPSYESACDLYRGDPTAIYRVGMGLLSRSVFIGAGLAVAGMRNPAELVKYSLAGSLGVEAFVIWWVWSNSPRKKDGS